MTLETIEKYIDDEYCELCPHDKDLIRKLLAVAKEAQIHADNCCSCCESTGDLKKVLAGVWNL